MFLLKNILNWEQHFSFSIFRSGLSSIRINCNGISEGLLYFSVLNLYNSIAYHEDLLIVFICFMENLCF
jgi:hypothetical protein